MRWRVNENNGKTRIRRLDHKHILWVDKRDQGRDRAVSLRKYLPAKAINSSERGSSFSREKEDNEKLSLKSTSIMTTSVVTRMNH